MLHLGRSFVKTLLKHISQYELLSEVTLSGQCFGELLTKHKGKVCKLIWVYTSIEHKIYYEECFCYLMSIQLSHWASKRKERLENESSWL